MVFSLFSDKDAKKEMMTMGAKNSIYQGLLSNIAILPKKNIARIANVPVTLYSRVTMNV